MSLAYSLYKATLFQAGFEGEAAPIDPYVYNSVGPLTWSYIDVGHYRLTIGGGATFPFWRTFVNLPFQVPAGYVTYKHFSETQIDVFTWSDVETTVPSNDVLGHETQGDGNPYSIETGYGTPFELQIWE